MVFYICFQIHDALYRILKKLCWQRCLKQWWERTFSWKRHLGNFWFDVRLLHEEVVGGFCKYQKINSVSSTFPLKLISWEHRSLSSTSFKTVTNFLYATLKKAPLCSLLICLIVSRIMSSTFTVGTFQLENWNFRESHTKFFSSWSLLPSQSHSGQGTSSQFVLKINSVILGKFILEEQVKALPFFSLYWIFRLSSVFCW